MSRDDGKEEIVAVALQENKAGAVMSLEQLFHQFHSLVFGTAYRMMGNAADAEDVLQTVFLRLVRTANLPQLEENPGGYFYRAAINASLDMLRRHQGIVHLPLDEEEVAVLPCQDAAPDASFDAIELEQWLRRTLAQLSPMAAEIFVLSSFEGLSHEEIAAILATSAGSVAVILHRTRNRLLKEMRLFLGGRS
jgi:RNA polymerase sigma-70 factor, ECF subfamily